MAGGSGPAWMPGLSSGLGWVCPWKLIGRPGKGLWLIGSASLDFH